MIDTENPYPHCPQLPRSVNVCFVAGVKHLRVAESYTFPGGHDVNEGMTTVTVVVLVSVLVTVFMTVTLVIRVVVTKLMTVFVGAYVICVVVGIVIVIGMVDVKVMMVVLGTTDVTAQLAVYGSVSTAVTEMVSISTYSKREIEVDVLASQIVTDVVVDTSVVVQVHSSEVSVAVVEVVIVTVGVVVVSVVEVSISTDTTV